MPKWVLAMQYASLQASEKIQSKSAEEFAKVSNALELKLILKLNKQAFKGKEMKINKPGSKMEVYVIPTNEELILARDTFRVVEDLPRVW